MGFNFVEVAFSDDLLSHEKARLKTSETSFAKASEAGFAKPFVLL